MKNIKKRLREREKNKSNQGHNKVEDAGMINKRRGPYS